MSLTVRCAGMTRFKTTLGTTGIAAAIVMAAFQFLPPRDGGAALANTPPQPAAPLRAWADPTRNASRLTVAAVPPATVLPAIAEAAPAAVTAPPSARRAPGARRIEVRGKPHRVAAVRRQRTEQAASQPARAKPAAPVVQTASARMGGPIGDILHGLGFD